MAKREALVRLYKALRARQLDLRKHLASELTNLRDFSRGDSTNDSADAAFDASSDEMSSQLAQWGARELSQVERALARLKQGTYGICEGESAHCQRKIPVARLNALPYASFCIHCEREIEKQPAWQERPGGVHWNRVVNAETHVQEPRLDRTELELYVSR